MPFWIIGILAVIIAVSAIYAHYGMKVNPPEDDEPAPSPRPTTSSTPVSAFPPPTKKPKYTFIDDPTLDGAVGSLGVKYYYDSKEYRYWLNADKKMFDLIRSGKYAETYKFLIGVLESKDNYEYAYELYNLIDQAIYNLYPMRNLDGCTDMILELGKRGFALIDGYIEVARQYTVWRFPTQIAIILEKQGKLEDAIELCKFLEERNVRDTGYNTFAARRLKLEERLKKRK